MAKRILALVLIVGFTPAACFAAPSEKSQGKSNSVMPVAVSAETAAFEQAKKAMDKALEEPSLSEVVEKKVEKAKEVVSQVVDKALEVVKDVAVKMELQKGDPKTTFSKGENRMHSSRRGSGDVRAIDLTRWEMGGTEVNGSVTNYIYYDSSNLSGYDYIVLSYDTLTNELLKATGFTVDESTRMPNLNGVDYVGSSSFSTRSGTITVTSYASLPKGTSDLAYATKWIDIYTLGDSFLIAYVKWIDDIDPASLTIPV